MAALAKLPPERRQVFIDAAIDGKSYQQVADEQGVKIGTVMSRLNRARTQLKRELSSYALAHGYGDARKQLPSSPSANSRSPVSVHNGDDGMRSVATSERSRRE